MKKILLTGATGFLGSHIAEELIKQGFKVIALKRPTSNLWRCDNFSHNFKWINIGNTNLAQEEIIKANPDILIHAAWGGVKSANRNNWIEQEKNLSFLTYLFDIVKKTKISKIIALGSQAEYGDFEGLINEKYNCSPNTAYGAAKVSSSIMLRSFAEGNNIDWYWIRLFSVFGPREDKTWLIPATITNLLLGKVIKLTPCEQKYDYIFTRDFASGIVKVVNERNNLSGVYNFSSGRSVKLRDILSFIENEVSPRKNLLKFGALPYRSNQVMNMQGNSNLFFKSFDFKPKYELYAGLKETIKYYINTLK